MHALQTRRLCDSSSCLPQPRNSPMDAKGSKTIPNVSMTAKEPRKVRRFKAGGPSTDTNMIIICEEVIERFPFPERLLHLLAYTKLRVESGSSAERILMR
ncbi:hypothetical protein BU26DRAFT_180691 [Trematosphaeria pertusa]|uniref:Uncharacterized protein n=1 Tax=Trematosphaeria pertusa TaxID=390896 RepID=A0A6A6HSG6_9PLEO|nr:uncharacterized protein BU26DRAFT_180691 [Trematosphaeria pertusa]KAF2241124.1 hypothetical protein BU26DRAFT_180691 [Trematosphaeria pertusa]